MDKAWLLRRTEWLNGSLGFSIGVEGALPGRSSSMASLRPVLRKGAVLEAVQESCIFSASIKSRMTDASC